VEYRSFLKELQVSSHLSAHNTVRITESLGTGKTLTAEACADLLHRPLYSVTSGNMGADAGTCERVLRDIFDLAKEWNALILLDEADVFLERRERGDLGRNGE
jgi:AAA+ superfamily predicted ATPase